MRNVYALGAGPWVQLLQFARTSVPSHVFMTEISLHVTLNTNTPKLNDYRSGFNTRKAIYMVKMLNQSWQKSLFCVSQNLICIEILIII